MFFQSLEFAVQVTFPIAIIIFLGAFLKRIDWINDEFSNIGSKLVFNLTLPLVLFFNIVKTDITADFPIALLVVAIILTTVFYGSFHFLANYISKNSSRGAFVQGSCRGNMGIIGLAVCASAFGEAGMPIASVYLSVLVVFYNVYSVMTLYYHGDEAPSWGKVVKGVVTNPLLIAIMIGLPFAIFQISLPTLITDTGNYLTRMTLPLALLCAGASIRLEEFKSSAVLYYAILSKTILFPLISVLIGYAMGLPDIHLGVLFVMMSAPTAAAAYPMARAVGADHHLTSAIIVGSTLFSIISTTVGLFLLHFFEIV